MTVYQLLCCVRSPNWFNYQNPLSSEFDYFKDKISQDLPQEAVDSYLGRLISVALVLNGSLDRIDKYNFKLWLQAMETVSKSEIFTYHKPGKMMLSDIEAYLDYGLPSSLLKPLLQVSILQLHTRCGDRLRLNDPKFLDCIRQLHSIKYTPLVLWFAENSHAVSENTLYQEELKEDTDCESKLW